MELWDVLDQWGNPTGKIIKRDDKLKDNEFHLGVHVWIVNSKNELLIQQRQENCAFAPGLWAAHGGKVVAGEKSFYRYSDEYFECLSEYLDLLS